MIINNSTAVERVRANSDQVSSEELRDLIVKGMQEKKAVDIAVMDLREVKNAICDYFVICSGNSDTQIDAIANSIDEEVHKATGQNPWHQEGKMNKEWILLDYVDVVAHVFKKDRRAFYDLEQLWGDADVQYLDEANPDEAPIAI
ncbi:ribosome silencing factor [Rudanella paleaurantiibacter]|uniref:Ribosomal silencing factor RsfS n=1 Tax=Rudanella paleaurantiibacter TaxID=2614655 RepID=A0A7J5U5S7_9BACT|nr:ribosome silencing factor [Rudanella paleaurantiibacter]KAB7733199.1 ribosome silencing factor [Rudanella paleaurantiibacter]